MGLGLVLGALAGAGKGVSDAAQDYQRAQTAEQAAQANAERETAMAKTRADLQVEAANRIAEANRAREQEPIKRFQSTVSDLVKKYTEDPSLIPAELLPKSATTTDNAQPATVPDTDTSGTWNEINASFASGEAARNEERRATIQAELDKETDPKNIAALQRELSRLPAAAESTAKPATTASPVKLTPAAIRDIAFKAAYADAKVNDPLAYKALGDALKGEKMHIGTGGAVLDPVTGETIYQNTTAKEIAEAKIKAAAEAQEKKLAADEARADKQIAAREKMAEMKINSAAAAKTVDPKAVEDAASLISSYAAKPLGDRARTTPFGQAVIARVREMNPNYNEMDYGAMDKSIKAFSTGAEGKIARSLNVAIDHIGTAESLIDALKNGDVNLINKYGNKLAAATGSTAPTNFNAVKHIVADEITKSVIGGAGALADREEMAKTIEAANSPEQIRGVLDQFKHLMRGQLDGLRDQYQRTTSRTDFDDKFLSPAAKAAMHVGGAKTNPANPTAPASSTARPSIDAIFGK